MEGINVYTDELFLFVKVQIHVTGMETRKVTDLSSDQ